jgi:signal transduction histidine kinase
MNGGAVLEVRDFGKGLSEEEARYAFDRFYRSDEGRNRETGGLGIGLSVVKRIVDSRLGSIEFVPVDCGAQVRVTLPCSSDVTATLSAR